MLRKGFWKSFKYCVRIHLVDGNTMKPEVDYVTRVNWADRTFEFHTLDEIKAEGKEVKLFDSEAAVDLMNRMFLNGYNVSIAPWFE